MSAAATKSSKGEGVAGVSEWKKQLITKEDPMHIHKSLGILCVISYLFRLVQTGKTDMGFATLPALTIPTVLLHLALNVSALEFKIPNKRISSGYRIWPEYRLHSLVFLARSLAVIALYWFENTYQMAPNYDWNLAIIILGMICADWSSYIHRDHQSKTIRDLDTPKYVQFLFSVAQFFGSANILFGLRRYSMHMLSVIIIQCNAFMMTIRRKNLAGHSGLVAMYGIMLLVAMFVCMYEYLRVDSKMFYVVSTMGHVAVFQRMTPWPESIQFISNKYVVWMTVGLALRQLRPQLDTIPTEQLRLVYIASGVLMYGLGWYKCFGPGSQASKSTKKA